MRKGGEDAPASDAKRRPGGSREADNEVSEAREIYQNRPQRAKGDRAEW